MTDGEPLLLAPFVTEMMHLYKTVALTVCLFEADCGLEPLDRDKLSSHEAEIERDLIDFRVRNPDPGVFFNEHIFRQKWVTRRSRQVQRRPLDGVEPDRLLADV